MAKAIWNSAVIAASEDVVEVEGNLYFPADSLSHGYFTASEKHTKCPWKGTASYYDVTVDGLCNAAAAWYYPKPKSAAEKIRGRVAFWQGIIVEK